ncbi:hypothetical protein EI983_12105 [Roseovarius faecimaris]|uniref:Translation initiation factor 2 n=1 Tax=Roseovarius faecimaris TaxID=2494550 RepID=A0A6I6IS15_9RHOB|nr:hypothetical protein [Roseovarius faecimaris]QGX98972.1 hypothetical protein EI983_12105 [Roseovarius faecimaris]
MKPNFALTLSFEGIGLLHRAFPGWHLVGDVGLDSTDLTGELAELRQKALLLDPSGMRTKIVLPDDQVKYLEINHLDGADLQEAVQAALDGATPYQVSELAYDFAEEGDRVTIAAVARETLAEAEAFAVEHQFNPVSFVAECASATFHGEPFFGLTVAAADQEVERDSAPVRIIGASKMPDPDASADTPDPDTPETEATSETAEAAPEADTPAEPEAGPSDTPAPEAAPQTASEPETEPEPEPASAEPAEEVVDAADDNSTLVAENSLPEDPAEDTPKPEIAPETEPETEADPPAAPAAAFSSIRARRDDAGSAPPRLDGVQRDMAPPRITLGAAITPEQPEEPPAITGISDAALPEDEAATVAPVLLHSDDADAAAAEDTPRAHTPAPAASAQAKAAAFFTRRSRDKTRKPDTRRSAIPDPQDEKQRMTIFGAREPVAVGGKPRFLGVILTAVLLLFLIGVAAWASIFMDDGLARFFRSEPDPVPAVADIPVTDPVEEVEEDVELASLQPNEPISVLDDPATEILSRVQPSDLSPDEARARYAATGIWQLAPEPSRSPVPRDMEDFYQTSLDPAPDFQDAVALPETARAYTDGMMFSPAPPPASDTRFIFDSRGFVLATPEGALTPDAVRVFAGRPPVLPPSQRSTPETQGTEPAEQATDALVAAIRPRARPDDLAEQIERSELSGRTRSELAALRPKLRPESAQEAAEAAEAARKQAEAEAAAASTTDPEALAAALTEAVQTPDPFAGATPQAVRASLKPKTKPSNFDRIVQRAQRNQDRQQDNAGATQEEAVAVLASQRVSPSIPTTASVAKRATERNALKFKRVNLIGVYGTPNKRRALVRMSNGRYKKVQVGDRLDGGKVQAIGDDDLRYVKGGRTVVLKMPRG